MKYVIALDIFTSKIVWISEAYKGGTHDKKIYMDGLYAKIPEGKKVICDRVFGSKEVPGDHKKLSLPNPCDPKELKSFKARSRSRIETLNGRLKWFRALSHEFRHDESKHQLVMYAICVNIQYQMDHGSPLFDP